MKKPDILLQALLKAKQNGWNGTFDTFNFINTGNTYTSRVTMKLAQTGSIAHINQIIFNHSFCEALFHNPDAPNEWRMHIQNMVVAEEPLFYLQKFL